MLWCYANNAKALRPSGQALGCRRGPRWSLRAPSPESPAAAHIGQVVLDANQTRFAYLKVHNCIVAKYIVRSYIVHSYIVHSTSLEVTDAQCASVRIGPHTRTRTHTHPYAHAHTHTPHPIFQCTCCLSVPHGPMAPWPMTPPPLLRF